MSSLPAVSTASASTLPASKPSESGSSPAENAFMIIINMMLQHMSVQQDAINLGMDREQFLKSEFDLQNQAVSAAQNKLNELIDQSAKDAKDDPDNLTKIQTDYRNIQGQMATVQAAGASLSYSRGTMVEEFNVRIAPAQKAIEQDSTMFGNAVQSFLLMSARMK